MEFTFTLKYQLPTHDIDTDVLIERLGEEGCEDALVGIGQPGRLALTFTREAVSAQGAMESALADVRRAVADARLIEVTPDLVGLTDVAEVMGVTRQNMRKLVVAYPSFPTPVHEGSAAIWHLAEVLSWMEDKGYERVPHVMRDIARVAMRVNIAKENDRLQSTM
jgi:predicted DNA-binding transcriptional regulator AlpA